jgi:hypothetical protein
MIRAAPSSISALRIGRCTCVSQYGTLSVLGGRTARSKTMLFDRFSSVTQAATAEQIERLGNDRARLHHAALARRHRRSRPHSRRPSLPWPLPRPRQSCPFVRRSRRRRNSPLLTTLHAAKAPSAGSVATADPRPRRGTAVGCGIAAWCDAWAFNDRRADGAHLRKRDADLRKRNGRLPEQLACSPKVDPGAMRV